MLKQWGAIATAQPGKGRQEEAQNNAVSFRFAPERRRTLGSLLALYLADGAFTRTTCLRALFEPVVSSSVEIGRKFRN